MLIKVQHGEEDGDAQNVPVQLQRVLLLAVCVPEGLIYCWFIPLWVAFALTGSQLPNCRLLLLGKVQGAVGGKVESIFPAPAGEAGTFRGWLAAHVQQRVSSPCVISSVTQWVMASSSPVSAAFLTTSALNLKINQHWSLGGKKGTPVYFKWQAEAAQSPVTQVLLLMFHSLLLAVPAVQCQHLWMCLLSVALLCVWCSHWGTHSINTFLAGMLQSYKLPCGSCVFIDRYSKWAECFCCVSPLGYSSHVAASTPACQDLLLLHFLNPPFYSRLVKHRLIPCSTGYFLFSSPVSS